MTTVELACACVLPVVGIVPMHRTGTRFNSSAMPRAEPLTAASASFMRWLAAMLSRSRTATSSGSRMADLRAGRKAHARARTQATGSCTKKWAAQYFMDLDSSEVVQAK